MTLSPIYEVYRFEMNNINDDALKTFTVRERAFDYARQFAIEHRCNMLVIEEGKDVLF